MFAFGLCCDGCRGTIEFDLHEATPPPRTPATVAMYKVDCLERTYALSDCTHNGAAANWKVFGEFHAPAKAASRWSRYQHDVWELAAAKGCPAVAFRADPPGPTDEKRIGAFCVDVTTAPTPKAGVPTVAVVAPTKPSASVAATPSSVAVVVAETDEEHIVTTVANGAAYFDLGLRNGLHVGSRVEILGNDGVRVTMLKTDLCGEILCRAQLSPTLVDVVKRGMRVRSVPKP